MITKIGALFLTIVLLGSGLAYFMFDESKHELIKNEIKDLDDENNKKEKEYLSVFAFLGLLAIICWVIREADKQKKI